jgi:hypothetical protein
MSLALGALLAACLKPAGDAVGVSHRPASTAESGVAVASTSAVASASAWEHADAFRGWTRANVRRFTSPGHLFGRWDADVYVNEAANAEYRQISPARPLADGAVVVEVLTRAGAAGEVAGPIFALERHDDETAFVEMDASGRVLRRGSIEQCVGCHAHVEDQGGAFGLPTAGR